MIQNKISKFNKAYLVLTTIFLTAFPKGGVKINEIPVTWGYILLFFSIPFCFIKLKFHKTLKPHSFTYILTLPFTIYSVIILSLSEIGHLGFLISFIISIIIMPFVFLVVFDTILDKESYRNLFIKTFKICIRFVIVFGIYIYFYKLITGISLEIPYLTINGDDYGLIDSKYNMRGSVRKLVSTYNNGNLFGICMLIISAMFLKAENRKCFQILFWIALVLTLSRTVWIGMLFLLFLYFLKYATTKSGILIITLTIIFVFIGLPWLVAYFNLGDNFLFDENLGGRVGQLTVLKNLSLTGNLEFGGIGEIVYLSIMGNFGLIGFILFLLYLFSPVIAYKTFNLKNNFIWGNYIYILICVSDGGILLIPVMAFYWFMASLVLQKQMTYY
ncbi:hypothetical protein EZS27_009115 [termite gut metagenome]|uniref:Uncharacterized protein n=1 Tax=termite gut metagenome TaxID=433724 RepID=A0A5J4SAG2_9ZZZZ